jgi:hypothetical protein
VKLFVSYTSSDRDWAHWIAWTLGEGGHEAFVHEWEVGAGESIPRWMEERLSQADKLLGVFSDAYSKAIYSKSERWAAYWDDPEGRNGFLVPIEVSKVSEWSLFVKPLRRLSLIDLSEPDARERLLTFLEPPHPPAEKPIFPGGTQGTPAPTSFTEGSEPLGTHAPAFPTPSPEAAATKPDADEAIRCIDDYEPKPVIFGREDEVETVVGALLSGKPSIVAGGPGMGKTAVATAALFDPRVVARFGRRRVFASLEAATESRAILAKLVEALGLPPTGDDASLLRILENNAAERPLAAVLDNAETVFDIDRAGSERLLSLVAHVPGLSLATTIPRRCASDPRDDFNRKLGEAWRYAGSRRLSRDRRRFFRQRSGFARPPGSSGWSRSLDSSCRSSGDRSAFAEGLA